MTLYFVMLFRHVFCRVVFHCVLLPCVALRFISLRSVTSCSVPFVALQNKTSPDFPSLVFEEIMTEFPLFRLICFFNIF